MTPRRALAEEEYRRRQALSRRRRGRLIGLTVAVVTVMAVLAVTVDRLLRPGAFPIKELRLEGEFVHLDPEAVRSAVISELGDNYFSLDLERIERAVEVLPWAHRATVQRSWPHSLTIRVEEQHPVARWGDRDWLNEDGQIIQLEQDVEANDLVRLRGPDSTASELWDSYRRWQSALRESGLEIDSITADERFAWSLELRPQDSPATIRVLLGVSNHDRRVDRLTRSFGMLRDTGSVVGIDLRYPNGMAVVRDEARPEDEVALVRLTDE